MNKIEEDIYKKKALVKTKTIDRFQFDWDDYQMILMAIKKLNENKFMEVCVRDFIRMASSYYARDILAGRVKSKMVKV